ncbi:MAG TPA: type II secretion system F family protein [Caulobacteraceae bacterium]|jgi:tight adherence protein B
MARFLPIAYVLAFIATVLLVQALAGLWFSTRDRSRTVNRRLAMVDSNLSRTDVSTTLVRRSMTPAIGDVRLDRLLEAIGAYCQQAGLTITPLRLLAIAAGGAGAIWLVGMLVLSSHGGGDLLTNGAVALVGACALSSTAVWLWVGRLRARRLKKLEEQMPLALDVINRALRAGHPVISAVHLAAQELGDPIGMEFGLVVDETTYGADFKDALTSFAKRTGSPDAHFFAASIAIQSETGGNLAEVLEGLASVIRGRLTLTKRIKALASEGRASATLLSVLPIVVVAFIFVANPAFYTSKFSDPVFWPVVSVVVVLYLIGQIMFHRIINFKY